MLTDIVLRRFPEGAASVSAETETVCLAEKKIVVCVGCARCWLKTPGVRRHKDDVPELHAKMRSADVIVYATPLYVCSMKGIMKRFLDRIMPLAQPFQENRDGVCSHPPEQHPEGNKGPCWSPPAGSQA